MDNFAKLDLVATPRAPAALTGIMASHQGGRRQISPITY